MRVDWLALLLTTLIIEGCRPHDQGKEERGRRSDPGWHYTWQGSVPHLTYGVPDPEGSEFVGYCDGAPTFALFKGDYGLNVERFTVATAGWQAVYAAGSSFEGRGLVLWNGEEAVGVGALPSAVHLAQAHGSIRITTDDGWTRTIPADPLIARFVSDCLWWLRAYPAGPPEWQMAKGARH